MIRKQWQGIDVTELVSEDGARAVVADHGAHLLSWTPAAGGPALYLSGKSAYGGSAAIRGGVPVIFPQFGERGAGLRHGFARVTVWEPLGAVTEKGKMVASYRLVCEGDAAGWPHRAELLLRIAFAGQELQMRLEVRNPSPAPIQFCAALHTYLQVGDIERTTLAGLLGAGYLDQVEHGKAGRQSEALLSLHGELDRIYTDVDTPLTLDDGARRIHVDKEGFADVVVWNPGAAKAAGLQDMPAQDYRAFLCVESAAVVTPVVLPGGGLWTGVQRVVVEPR